MSATAKRFEDTNENSPGWDNRKTTVKPLQCCLCSVWFLSGFNTARAVADKRPLRAEMSAASKTSICWYLRSAQQMQRTLGFISRDWTGSWWAELALLKAQTILFGLKLTGAKRRCPLSFNYTLCYSCRVGVCTLGSIHPKIMHLIHVPISKFFFIPLRVLPIEILLKGYNNQKKIFIAI